MSQARILIADDDAVFRLAMGKALRRKGFAVEEAASGEEAIAAIQAGTADVALLNLQLGDLDGREVLRRTRGRRTKVIVVTGHGTIAAAVEALRLGAVNFIQKPVDAPALVPLLQDALQGTDWRRPLPATTSGSPAPAPRSKGCGS